jgi:CheY-like chemotaxis protein
MNMNTKLNILIVEDKPKNIAAAQRQLEGHNLVIVSGFDDALTALKRNGYARRTVESPDTFDAVLTDCMYPKGGTACMGPKGAAVVNCQGEMPYGPMIVLHAIECGIPFIGLITQGNHHDDPFVFALDRLTGFKGQNTAVAITNSLDCLVYTDSGERVDPNSPDYKDHWKAAEAGKVRWVKDWNRLLLRAMGTEPAPQGDWPPKVVLRQI